MSLQFLLQEDTHTAHGKSRPWGIVFSHGSNPRHLQKSLSRWGPDPQVCQGRFFDEVFFRMTFDQHSGVEETITLNRLLTSLSSSGLTADSVQCASNAKIRAKTSSGMSSRPWWSTAGMMHSLSSAISPVTSMSKDSKASLTFFIICNLFFARSSSVLFVKKLWRVSQEIHEFNML